MHEMHFLPLPFRPSFLSASPRGAGAARQSLSTSLGLAALTLHYTRNGVPARLTRTTRLLARESRVAAFVRVCFQPR